MHGTSNASKCEPEVMEVGLSDCESDNLELRQTRSYFLAGAVT